MRITSTPKQRHTAVVPMPYAPLERNQARHRQQRGSKLADLYPLTPDADIRALQRAASYRDSLIADLPDTLTEAEYEAANEAWARIQPRERLWVPRTCGAAAMMPWRYSWMVLEEMAVLLLCFYCAGGFKLL